MARALAAVLPDVTKPSPLANKLTQTVGVHEHQAPATQSRTSPTNFTLQVSLRQCSARTAVREEQTTSPGSHTPALGTVVWRPREAYPATVRPDLMETYSTTASPVEEIRPSSPISTLPLQPITSGSLQPILTTCTIIQCRAEMPTYRIY